MSSAAGSRGPAGPPRLYASVDLGGTKIAALLADGDGRVVAERTEPTAGYAGPEAVLRQIAALVEALAAEAGARPAALGLGCPGLVDPAAGATRFLPNLPGHWRDVPVAQTLAPRLGCPVYLLNDARMATLGELVFGRGRGVSSMVYFTVGTGIGGGIVANGRLVLGPAGAAGELGHQTVVTDGPPCSCGGRGCLEVFASGPALTGQGVRLLLSGQAPRLREIVAGDPGAVTVAAMGAAAEAGDAAVAAAIAYAARLLGVVVANMIAAVQPTLVVIGGGVARLGAPLFDTVAAEVHARIGALVPRDGCAIVPAALGERAGALGGIALASQGLGGGMLFDGSPLPPKGP